MFITFEGGEGSGKTTQINLFVEYLEQQGVEVLLTREPGGTVISEKIREIILDKEHMEMADTTEALLYAASRVQHVNEFIIPKLKEGKTVISDRYLGSSVVYQGIVRGLGMDYINRINSNLIIPDITFLLDVDSKKGLTRKSNQQDLDRLELEGESFHQKVNQAFREWSFIEGNRVILIKANSIEAMHNQIITEYQERFGDSL